MTLSLHNSITKILLGIFLGALFIFSLSIQYAHAQTATAPTASTVTPVLGTCPPGTSPLSFNENGSIATCSDTAATYGGEQEAGTAVVARIINIVLGFLGLIALILFIVGGFQWMTSGGNEEKTAGAKKLMVSAIIGLVIILGAAVISNFAFTAIERSFTGTSTGRL